MDPPFLPRLLDNVCMTCEKDFVEVVIRELESECFTIGSSFGGGGKTTLDTLFKEDPTVLLRRNQLKDKRKRLCQALQTLR